MPKFNLNNIFTVNIKKGRIVCTSLIGAKCSVDDEGKKDIHGYFFEKRTGMIIDDILILEEAKSHRFSGTKRGADYSKELSRLPKWEKTKYIAVTVNGSSLAIAYAQSLDKIPENEAQEVLRRLSRLVSSHSLLRSIELTSRPPIN